MRKMRIDYILIKIEFDEDEKLEKQIEALGYERDGAKTFPPTAYSDNALRSMTFFALDAEEANRFFYQLFELGFVRSDLDE